MLVVRRELLTNRVPDVVGGGTVAYVNPDEHVYLDDHETREEGGTPAIVESIRAGLVFQLKDAVGTDVIRAHEEDYLRRAVSAWDAAEGVEILGNTDPYLHAHVWPRYDWEPEHLVGRPVWLYPLERWSDPGTALGPAHDDLRAELTAEIDQLRRRA